MYRLILGCTAEGRDILVGLFSALLHRGYHRHQLARINPVTTGLRKIRRRGRMAQIGIEDCARVRRQNQALEKLAINLSATNYVQRPIAGAHRAHCKNAER